MAETYIYVNGEQIGPLPVEEIKSWVEDGRMGPDDQVWIQARNEWVMARNVAQFKRIFAERGIDTSEEQAAPKGLMLSIAGDQYGPYPATQIITFINEGRLNRQDFVWIERHQKWFELEKIVQFRQAFEKAEQAGTVGGGAAEVDETAEEQTPAQTVAEDTAPETAPMAETSEATESTAAPETTETAESEPAAAGEPGAETDEEGVGPVLDSDWSSFGEDTDERPVVTDADIVRRAFSDRPAEGGALGTIGDFVSGTEKGTEPPVREETYVDPSELPLMKANAAKRLGGLVWDFVICFLFIAVLGIIFYLLDSVFKDVLFFKVFNPNDTMGILEGAGFLSNLSRTFIFISIGVIFLYLLLRDVLFGKRSLGKRLAGLRVVDRVSKQPGSGGKLILRNLTVATVAPLLIEILLVLADSKGLRIGDRLAQTQVVDTTY
ncbi:MAG: DUF4339 domain-containing protein [Candidatus Coatesbacteria bacterium]|nr:DUF4339 domain-containing protein [Candidatus Coatesbacteria bacterium]